MTIFAINEVFETIQGEAFHAGTPSVFVRLQGCDVGCPWCDTKHTWAVEDANAISVEAMLAKGAAPAPTFARMSGVDLVELVVSSRFNARHVVITGGEPCVYDLAGLTHALTKDGRSVQVETSGTEPVRVSQRTWVTVSPKLGMPGGREVLDQALRAASEIKMPVGKPADIAKAESIEARLRALGRSKVPLWLQPLSESEKATTLCAEQAILRAADNWRLSIQTHKVAGLR